MNVKIKNYIKKKNNCLIFLFMFLKLMVDFFYHVKHHTYNVQIHFLFDSIFEKFEIGHVLILRMKKKSKTFSWKKD